MKRKYRAVTPDRAELGGSNLKNFQNQESFKKIHHKCIPLCTFIYFELIFKVSESLNLLTFPCEILSSVKEFLNISTNLQVKIYLWL